jgi:hypothetical protein
MMGDERILAGVTDSDHDSSEVEVFRTPDMDLDLYSVYLTTRWKE